MPNRNELFGDPQATFGGGGVNPAQMASQAVATTAQDQERRRRRREMTREMAEGRAVQDYLESSRGVGGVAQDTGLGLLQGATHLGAAAFGLGNMATGGNLERATGMSENFSRTNEILERARTPQLRYEKQQADRKFEEEGVLSGFMEYASNPALIGDLMATNVASLMPGAAVGARVMGQAGAATAARGAAGESARREATQRGARAIAGTTGAQAGGNAYTQAYDQAIQEGADEDTAHRRAQIAAGIAGPITGATAIAPGIGAAPVEASVISRLMGQGATVTGPAGEGVARAAGRGASAFAREATQEAIQSPGETLAQNVVSENREWSDDLAKSAAIGTVAGGGLGLGMGAVQAPSALRSEIDSARERSAENLGRPEAGQSQLEQEGERKLAADQLLESVGFQQTPDGRFVSEELAPGMELDRGDAVRLAEMAFGDDLDATGAPEQDPTQQEDFTEEQLAQQMDQTPDPLAEAKASQTEYDLLGAAGFREDSDGRFFREGEEQIPFTREEALLQASADQMEVTDLTEQRELEAAGFTRRGDGNYQMEGDPLTVFTPEQAVETAGVTARMDERQRSTGIPLPEVVEGPDVAVEERAGFAAFQKAREQAFEVFGPRRRDPEGRDAYEVEIMDDGGNSARDYLGELDANAVLEQMGRITPFERAEADRLAQRAEQNRRAAAITATQQAPRSDRPMTREDIMGARDAAFQQAARESGYETDDNQSFYRVTEDGELITRSRNELSEELNIQRGIDRSEDLLGRVPPQPVDVTPQPVQMDTAEQRQQSQQESFQFEYMNPIQQATVDRRVGADRDSVIRENWDTLMRRVIEDVNQNREAAGLKRINLTRSSMNSRAVRDLKQRAVDRDIDIASPEAFTFLQEEAQRLAGQDSVASEIVNTVSEAANAVSARQPDVNEARRYLLRRGVSKPGQARGPVYQRWKQALNEAGARPGTDAFERFMQQFSENLSAEDLNNAFGAGVRELYPANTPADVVQQMATPETPQAAQLAQQATRFTPTDEVQAIRWTVFERAVENARTGETAQAKQDVQSGKTQAQRAQRDYNDANRQVEEAQYEQVQQAAQEAEAQGQNSAEAARGALDQVRTEYEQLVERSRAARDEAVEGLKQLYNRLVNSRSKLTLQEQVRARVEALGEAVEEGTDPRISGIPKDIADPVSWMAAAEAMVESDMYAELDTQTKVSSFLSPMVERLYDLVSGVNRQYAYSTYRDIMANSGFFDAINNLPDGPQKQFMQRAAENVENYIDAEIARGAQDPANTANQKPFKRDPESKFSRLPAEDRGGEPIPMNELEGIVQRANEEDGNYIPVEAVRTAAEAEQMIGSPVPGDAVGVYYGGRALVIAENLRSPEMAYEAIMHERTHGGLAGLLGEDRLRAVLNRLWTNRQTRKRIQNKMAARDLTRLDAAEEVLADMVAAGDTLNKSVFSKIRAALGRFTDSILGIGDITMSDRAVNELLRDTVDYMRGAKHEINMGESYMDGLEPFRAVFEGEAVPTSPRFSRAVDALDQVADGALKESDVTRLSNRYRDMATDTLSRNFSKDVYGARTREVYGKARRQALKAMPLAQLANLAEGLFVNEEGVDLGKYLRDLKLAKQNEFNRTVNSKKKVKYRPGRREGDSRNQDFEVSPRDVATQWRDLVNKRSNEPRRKAMDRVQHDGTFFRIFPELTWEEQSTMDYTRVPFTQAERRQAYDRMRDDWNRMGSEFQDIYRKSQAIYDGMWQERATEVHNQISRIAQNNETMPDPDNPEQRVGTGEWRGKMEHRVQQMMNQISDGPYSPLQRRGEYYVVIRDPEGNVVFNSGHDSLAEAQMTEQGMKGDDGLEAGYTIATGKQGEFVNQLDGISQSAYQSLERALEGAFPEATESDRIARADALAAIQEVYLSSMPDRALMSHANRRKNVGGAVIDSFRAFNDYSVKSARNLSSMRYDHDIQKTLADIDNMTKADHRESAATNARRQEYAAAFKEQHLGSQQYGKNKLIDGATQSAFLYWMTSPSQMALNVSQTALVTLPKLGARYGYGQVAKWIGEASKHYGMTRTKGMHDENATTLNKNSVEYQVMRSLNNDGTLDFTLAHDISDLAQKDTSLTQTKWDSMVRMMATFIHKSEVFNRETAAFVAARGYMEQNSLTQESIDAMPEDQRQQTVADISHVAREAVLDTQFDYSQANKAVLTQGPVKRMVFQFQQFRLNMLGLMGKDIMDSLGPANTPQERAKRSEARRTVAYMQLTQLALTGIKGSVAAPVLFGLGSMFQDDDEISSVEEKMTQALPRWVTMGMLSGAIDTQRFGFQSLLPVIGGRRYMPTTDEPQEMLDHVLLNSLGPAYGLSSQVTEGFQDLAVGDFTQAASKLTPRLFGDPINTAFVERDELLDNNEIGYYEQGMWDRVANAAGLRTGRQASAMADRNAIYSGMRRASDRRSNMLGRYAVAESYEERQQVFEEIAQWNQRNGQDETLRITQSALKQARRRRQDNEQAAARWGVPRTRIPQQLKDMRRVGTDGD